jgi:hypothetical protein
LGGGGSGESMEDDDEDQRKGVKVLQKCRQMTKENEETRTEND